MLETCASIFEWGQRIHHFKSKILGRQKIQRQIWWTEFKPPMTAIVTSRVRAQLTLYGEQLLTDHKPDIPEERDRIYKIGGMLD